MFRERLKYLIILNLKSVLITKLRYLYLILLWQYRARAVNDSRGVISQESQGLFQNKLLNF